MELFSRRKKAVTEKPTTYRYDLTNEFKNQVLYIWTDSIGFVSAPPRQTPLLANLSRFGMEREDEICRLYSEMVKVLCDEHGKLGLPGNGPCNALFHWLIDAETDIALDIIELSFRAIPIAQQQRNFMVWVEPALNADDAIAKLNRRFQENDIGYRFESGQIVRLDSEFLHSEVTEPAFRLLYTGGYEGPLEEFRLAHKHYRNGGEHYDDCLTNCGKSLESTLKAICDRRKWRYKAGDTASKLLDLVFSKGLIPSYLQSHFSALRTTLESGVPTIRNREGGHGSGEKPNDVPEYLAAYQLHLTASAIVFLIRANEDFDKRKS
jgi:hypothetical protein